MDKNTFLDEFAKLVGCQPGSIKGDEELSTLGGWDSLGVLTFAIFAEEKLGTDISAAELARVKKVDDIIVLLGKNIIG